MAERFADKVILVTGGTLGMGRAVAGRLAGERATVVLAARSQEDGDAVAAELRADGGDAHFVAADVTVEAQVARARPERSRPLRPARRRVQQRRCRHRDRPA